MLLSDVRADGEGVVMRLYISGPMTGLPNFNRDQFNRAAGILRAAAYDVVNPAELPAGWTWDEYMARALADLRTCDAMAMLPGWPESKGARKELQEALRLDFRVREWTKWIEYARL